MVIVTTLSEEKSVTSLLNVHGMMLPISRREKRNLSSSLILANNQEQDT